MFWFIKLGDEGDYAWLPARPARAGECLAGAERLVLTASELPPWLSYDSYPIEIKRGNPWPWSAGLRLPTVRARRYYGLLRSGQGARRAAAVLSGNTAARGPGLSAWRRAREDADSACSHVDDSEIARHGDAVDRLGAVPTDPKWRHRPLLTAFRM